MADKYAGINIMLWGWFPEHNFNMTREKASAEELEINLLYKDEIVAYLKSGKNILRFDEEAFDIFAPRKICIDMVSAFMDDKWVWPSYLSYYVIFYNVVVPLEFVKHMQRNNWVVPVPPSQEHIDIAYGAAYHSMRVNKLEDDS